jgi:hypothetical protein
MKIEDLHPSETQQAGLVWWKGVEDLVVGCFWRKQDCVWLVCLFRPLFHSLEEGRFTCCVFNAAEWYQKLLQFVRVPLGFENVKHPLFLWLARTWLGLGGGVGVRRVRLV